MATLEEEVALCHPDPFFPFVPGAAAHGHSTSVLFCSAHLRLAFIWNILQPPCTAKGWMRKYVSRKAVVAPLSDTGFISCEGDTWFSVWPVLFSLSFGSELWQENTNRKLTEGLTQCERAIHSGCYHRYFVLLKSADHTSIRIHITTQLPWLQH